MLYKYILHQGPHVSTCSFLYTRKHQLTSVLNLQQYRGTAHSLYFVYCYGEDPESFENFLGMSGVVPWGKDIIFRGKHNSCLSLFLHGKRKYTASNPCYQSTIEYRIGFTNLCELQSLVEGDAEASICNIPDPERHTTLWNYFIASFLFKYTCSSLQYCTLFLLNQHSALSDY